MPSSILRSATSAFVVFLIATASILAASGAAQAARQAAIVVDARNGQTLYADNADTLCYPASLTKMMTLYLTFEGLQKGRFTKSSRIPVSKKAAAQAPSKLGLKPGQTITVEMAILALVTKSANDVAMALGEFVGGSEADFARMMTKKARALGMSRTTFRNPSGLPDPEQVTTARDMARLGLALREHFPKYYGYFATRSFTYGKRRMANHNKLLGRVTGVDGIKTGYTRASGFNLVTSAGSGKKRIVAVVLGGKTGRERDARMAGLVNKYLPKSSGKGSGALIAMTAPEPAPARTEKPDPVVAAAIVAAPKPADKPAPKTPQAKPDIDPVTTASVTPRSGWAIQVASMPDPAAARAFLAKVQKQAGPALGGAEPYTETFDNKGVIYHRARFGGFSGKQAASNACASLKMKKFACFAVGL